MVFGGETAESYYDEGLTASVKGDLEKAVSCFERALELDRNFLAAHHQLAKCALRLGQTDRAVHLLLHVVRSKPGQVPPRIDLGWALLAAGKAKEARRQFEQILAVELVNSRALLGLAQADFDEGQWAAAASNAKLSLLHSGPNFPALFLLGRAARLSGDMPTAHSSLEEADAIVEKSVELSPDQPEGYFLRGEVCFAREAFHAALEHYRAAADRADSDRRYSAFGITFVRLDLLAKQGLCFQRLGQPDRARELGEQILKTNPDHKLARALLP